MSQHDTQPVKVKILGKEYRIGCSSEEQANLLQAAHMLDEKMREVRDAGVAGQEKIAIMAALNLIHELLSKPSSPDMLAATNTVSTLSDKIQQTLNQPD